MKLASQQRAAVRRWSVEAQVESEVAQNLRIMATETSASPFGWLSGLLVMLRSAAVVHQAHHWQTKGMAFYADHQLYMRLYEDSLDLIDGLAERAVGLGGGELVCPTLQTKYQAMCVQKTYEGSKVDEGPNGMAQISLQVEYRVLEGVKIVLGVLRQAGVLSDGTENLLQGIADKHEEFVYLLKQRAVATPYSYAR